MQVRFLKIAMVLAAGSAAGILFGSERNETPPTVSVAPVKAMTESAAKKYVGSIEACEKVELVPRVTGFLWKINFKEGDYVKEGSLLFELEDTSYRANVKIAEAQLAQINSELAYAKLQLGRNKRLMEGKAISVSTLDDAERAYRTNSAKRMEAEAALVNAKTNESYTKIHAPISGRIGKVSLTRGNLVTPSTGKLADIEMISPIYVRFSLSERVFREEFGGLNHIADRAVIQVVLANGKVYPEFAKIKTIDNKIDTKSNTATLWAEFENKDRELIPGSFVTVLLSTKRATPPVGVCHSALVTDQNGTFVFVLDGKNRAERRAVVTGNCTEEMQEIKSGLKAGETVIVEGTHKAAPGMTVTPVPYTEGK